MLKLSTRGIRVRLIIHRHQRLEAREYYGLWLLQHGLPTPFNFDSVLVLIE